MWINVCVSLSVSVVPVSLLMWQKDPGVTCGPGQVCVRVEVRQGSSAGGGE